MAELSDQMLIARATVFGNRRAFDTLVRRYQSPLRRFLMNLTGGDNTLSDDLAQDTFIKAYVNIRQFRGTASFSTWLMRIAYNVFYDYRRKVESEGRKVEGEYRAADISQSTLNSPSSTLKMDIYAALALLKPDERTCITLQLIDGQPIDEIAKITEMPAGTVKSHLSRGKEKLTTYLKKNGYDRK